MWYTDIPAEWLYITSVSCCILLCVFSGAVTFVHEQRGSIVVTVLCKAELCVFVMYEISIDFCPWRPWNTIKKRKEKEIQDYFSVTESKVKTTNTSSLLLLFILSLHSAAVDEFSLHRLVSLQKSHSFTTFIKINTNTCYAPLIKSNIISGQVNFYQACNVQRCFHTYVHNYLFFT